MGCTSSAPADANVDFDPKKPLPKKKADSEYEKGKSLGVGASCSVYRATRKGTKQAYAMKILVKSNKSNENDNEFLFKNEINTLRRLKHPNILQFVDAFEDDKAFVLVTGLCTGGELFDKVAEGSFSERAAAALARQMLSALAHCHERHVVHRDLKPENFVFESREANSKMKLIDFGCALYVQDDELVKDVAGSPYYVAPEVLNSSTKRTGKIWKAADMWSVGVIIFLLVHGYPPFNGESQEQIFHKIRQTKFKFSKDIQLSAPLRDLITKLLVADPLSRLSAVQALNHPWVRDSNAAPDTPLSKNVVAALTDFRNQYRLKKAVAKAVAKSMMTSDDEEQLSSLFKQFDANGDGRLDATELAALMKHVGKNPADAKQFLADYDDNDDGTLSKDELKTVIGMAKLSNADDIKKSFDMFDENGDGVVTQDEITRICKDISPDLAKTLIKEVDQNGDGRVNYKEWLAAMTALTQKAAAPVAARGIKY